MSRLLDKTTNKFRKKAGEILDRLRVPSQDGTLSPSSSRHRTIPAGSDAEATQTRLPAGSSKTAAHLSTAAPSVLAPDAVGTSPPPADPVPSTLPAYVRAPSPTTLLATTGSTVKGLLEAVRNGSDLFLPLKAALIGVLAIWDIFDRTAEAENEFMKLESKLVAFKAIADAQRNVDQEVDQSLQTRLASISQAVQSLWEAVERKQARGEIARKAQSAIDLDDIKTLISAISSLLEVFQFESSIAVENRLGRIIQQLDEDRTERRELESAKKQEKVMAAIISAFGDNFVSEAAHDVQPSSAGCMVGTRVGVLDRFITWARDDPLNIFWLAGMAGTEKTSIAVSLCRALHNDPDVFLGGHHGQGRSFPQRCCNHMAVDSQARE